MIDYELLNKQINSFNPFKEDPRQKHIREMASMFLDNLNNAMAKIYREQTKKEITNEPSDDMIKFTTSNELAVIGMSSILSLIYEPTTNCLILEDMVYDEHQKAITSNKFNALLLWTRIFSKLKMIKLNKHDKDNKQLEYKVLDKKLVQNIYEFSEYDLQSIRNSSKTFDLKKYDKYLSKYNEKDLKGKSDKEINEMAEKDMNNLLVEMMNDITKVLNV